jgi:hypothetical protein
VKLWSVEKLILCNTSTFLEFVGFKGTFLLCFTKFAKVSVCSYSCSNYVEKVAEELRPISFSKCVFAS